MTSRIYNSEKWLIMDCMGCTFFFVGQFILIFSLFTFCYYHLLPLNGEIYKTINFVFSIVLYTFCVLFHYKAMTTNPVIVIYN